MHETIERPATTVDQAEATETAAPETQGAAELITELAVLNGTARIGDPVTTVGGRGYVVAFEWMQGTGGLSSQWGVVVRENDGGEMTYASNLVELVLDELRREAGPGLDEDLYPVPTDKSFGGRATKEALELAEIGRRLIETTGDFDFLRDVRIDYVWDRKGGSQKNAPKLSQTRGLAKYEKRSSNAKFMITVSADVARVLRLTKPLMEALIHERLCEIGLNQRGKLALFAPDFRGYKLNVQRFGAILPSNEDAVAVLRASEDARMASMFEDEEDVGV